MTHECPKCGGELRTVDDNEFYHGCMFCIEGWTTEELNGVRRYKKWLKEIEQ